MAAAMAATTVVWRGLQRSGLASWERAPRAAPASLRRGLARGSGAAGRGEAFSAPPSAPAAPSAPGVAMGPSSVHGLGVFAARAFRAGEVVEVCPCLEISREALERAEPDAGVDLRDYLFDVRPQDSESASEVMLLPLGCGMAYNHRNESNVTYKARPLEREIVFRARRPLARGEELFVDYGEEWWRSRGWRPMEQNFALLRARLGAEGRS